MTSEEKLFKFIKPNDNDKFTQFYALELLYFYELLNDYFIEYRDSLNFENEITFGFEIECEKTKKPKINASLKHEFPDGKWFLGLDETVYYGGEVSTPVLTDSMNTWESVQKVCSILSKHAKEGESCGGHIHVGSQIFGNNIEYWINFLKLLIAYEKILFRFGNGEYLNSRPNISLYASPSAKFLYDNFFSTYKNNNIKLERLIKIINLKKFQSVNFSNVKPIDENVITRKNTIEFRSPNGTLNPIIWQNNLNFIIHLLNYAKNSGFDANTIENRMNYVKDIYPNIHSYEMIYSSEALELADLIFDTNLDKINFLKQYFKNFQKGNGENFREEKVVLTRKK